MKNEGKNMKPQSAQRETLCSPGEYPLKDVTERIISCAIEVHSTLGPGLLESLYEEALVEEFALRGIPFERQKEVALKYKGKEIGKHRIDLLVEDKVIPKSCNRTTEDSEETLNCRKKRPCLNLFSVHSLRSAYFWLRGSY